MWDFVHGIKSNIKQARKLGKCDNYLQSETINDPITNSLTHSLTEHMCNEMLLYAKKHTVNSKYNKKMSKKHLRQNCDPMLHMVL